MIKKRTIKKIDGKIESPLWLASLTRAKNKEFLKGKKGDIWVCGLDAEQPWCKKTKCKYCGRECYYVPENADLVKENAKKICPACALEKHRGDISEEMKEMLKRVVEGFE